jgi:hypothetical protein
VTIILLTISGIVAYGPRFGSLGVSCIMCQRRGTVLFEKPHVT